MKEPMGEQVRRDSLGIPFLRAPDVLSLAQLQGQVTALDRAWQIELDRRHPAPDVREVVYAADTAVGRLELLTLGLPKDADKIYGWTRGEDARSWGMREHNRETVRAIYAYLDQSPHHSARLWWLDGRPVGLTQTYAPEAEAVGECYPVRPSDLGVHFLVAPIADRPPGLTDLLGDHALRSAFADPVVYRLVVEPDIANHRAIERMQQLGFVCGPVIELPEKTAQLAFLTRDRWADLYGD